MRHKLGALLCLALGGVLIFSGIQGAGAGGVGEVVVPTDCGSTADVGIVVNPGNCPTGTLDLSEFADRTANPDATVPTGWTVTLTSTNSCVLPASETDSNSAPDKWTQVVAEAGSVSFQGLYIYKDDSTVTYCEYSISETDVDGFTHTFDPTAPYSFFYVPSVPTDVSETGTGTSSGTQRDTAAPRVARPHAFQGTSPLTVVLTNVAAAAAPPTTAAPTTRSATTSASSSPVSTTTSATTSAPIACGDSVRGQYRAQRCPGPITDSASNDPASASTSPALANTGPNRPVTPSLFVGIALCLLGLVLLVAGRRRPRGEHA